MAADLASFDLDATWKYVNVRHTGLEPRELPADLARPQPTRSSAPVVHPQAGLPLTRVSLALDRWALALSLVPTT